MKTLGMVVVLVGCGRGKDAQQCGADAYDLQQLLKNSDHDPSVVNTPINLVSRPELPKLGSKVESVVEIRGDVRVHGKPVSPTELHGELVTMHDWEPRRGRIIFAIDGAARWDIVTGAISTAAEAQIDKITLAFAAKPPASTSPPRAPIDDKLDGVENGDPSERATQYAKALTGIIASCPPLKKAFGAVGSEEGDKTSQIIDMLGPSLTECGCNVDMPALRSLMYRVVVNKHPATALTIELSDHGTPITLPASATWAEASKKLGPDTKQVTLAIAP